MSNELRLVRPNSLRGNRVALSVSESGDLERLGLSSMHLDLAVAELCRAIFFAGGIVVYGGRINWGFTSIVLDEAERYRNRSGAFEHYLPYSEHVDVPTGELREYVASLGVKCTVHLLDANGVSRAIDDNPEAKATRYDIDQAQALTAMRAVTSDVCDARVVLGGKVVEFQGSLPGIAEEAALTVRRSKPLYVAGGFGGAAALVGSLLAPQLYQWKPTNMPSGLEVRVVDDVAAALGDHLPEDGLEERERASLAATHRPSDIASLAVLELSRLAGLADGSA